jgi:hypothetical protein
LKKQNTLVPFSLFCPVLEFSWENIIREGKYSNGNGRSRIFLPCFHPYRVKFEDQRRISTYKNWKQKNIIDNCKAVTSEKKNQASK